MPRRSQSDRMIKLDDGAAAVIRRLGEKGYKAYAVGGCVRDLLEGKTPHDYDIATSASPEEVIGVFDGETIVPTGLKHGTVTLVKDKIPYEITTFRKDGDYADGRRPESVEFVRDIESDLSRRDFTVNAMAYNDADGLIDPFGGERDIKNKILRCVGDPDRRFDEDALRILRLVRFCATLGFTADGRTAVAADRKAGRLNAVSAERVFEEIDKLLQGDYAVGALLKFRRIMFAVIPELAPCDGFRQRTPWHRYDVYGHIARSVGYARKDPAERWCMLLHDVAKPDTFSFSDGKGHFYGHARVSAEKCAEIFNRLKFPSALKKETLFLIENHGYPLKNDERAIKRAMNKFGDKAFFKILDVHMADNLAQGTALSENERKTVEQVRKTALRIIGRGDCYSLKTLGIDGEDLVKIGFKGEEVGETLNKLLRDVIDGRLPNNRDALYGKSVDMYERKTRA